MAQEYINKGSMGAELDKELVKSIIAGDIIDRIDNLMATAPKLFEHDNHHTLGKVHRGEIQIAVRSIVEGTENTTRFYVIEDNGIVFTAERHVDDELISSIFISAGGEWPRKFEHLENSVREARYPL